MTDQTVGPIAVNGPDFEEKVRQSPDMVVVNFSSERSNACQLFEPEFAAVSREFLGRGVTFALVNVDSNEELTSQYNVDGIPTLVFFKSGLEINRIKGIVMREKLRRQVEGTLLVSSHANRGDSETA